jgi:Mg/Co/Ni transporter MgtE
MRGEEGEIHRKFVECLARAIKAGDAAILRRKVAELREADLGDLIAALEPDDRVRALATRELGANNAWRVVLRESMVGLVNGLAFALITAIAAVAWFKVAALGVVMGLAIVCNLVAGAWAAS